MKKLIITLFTLFSFSLFARTLDVSKVLELSIDSSINPATLNYIKEGFAKAKKEEFHLMLIKMNTPGGLVSTTKEIITEIGKSQIPVAIWITPEGASATSAGAIISSAPHFLFMSPGTNIGAATPIQMGKDVQKDMRSKAINDLVGLTKSLSEQRGRDPKSFGLMISKANSYSANEALKKKIINGIASTQDDIFDFIRGKKTNIVGEEVIINIAKLPGVTKFEMDIGQKILNIFSNPNMAYILFIIGAALIYLELQAPGGFIAGGVGLVCLLIAAIGFQVLPVNFGALALIVLSFFLFILEIYITSYGVLSLAGLASLIFGSLFLFRSENSYLELQQSVIISTVSAVAIYIAGIGYFFFANRNHAVTSEEDRVIGKEGRVNEVITQDQDKYYQVLVNGEVWKAISADQLAKGDHVIVEGLDSIILKVKKV